MKNFYCKKLKEIVKTDNRFVFGAIYFDERKPGLRDMWVAYKDKREIRVPRIEPLYPRRYLKGLEKAGFDVIVFDMWSSRPWLNKGAGKAIFHISFLQAHFPSLLGPEAYLKSAEYGTLINENSDIGRKLARKHLSPTEKRKVMKEFDGRCYACESTENLTIHHILDRQFGGGTEILNSVPLCRECHGKVHNRVIDRWSLEILRYRHGYANLRKNKDPKI
ncbi:MAG: HNH endonuclease [Candidatus Bathyarchaeia archaeon]|jgi:hypothetical protein